MSKAIRPRRSVLYMPASNARALDKAKGLEADGLILDLEDAVAPDAKEQARTQAVAAVTGGGFGLREVIVRVNGLETAWGMEDVKAVAKAGPDAVLFPKISSAAELARCEAALNAAGAPAHTRLWVMIETPLAIVNSVEIAAQAALPGSRLSCFVMGTNDLAKETRARLTPGRLPMLAWLSTALAAARISGLDILDGVYNGLQDAAGLTRECEEGRDLGMDGKTLIHPSQIAEANRIFAPTDQDVEQARAIVAAFDLPENRSKGVITVGGRMVELMHAEMGRRTLAIAEAIAARRA